ncbi:hypothetical protein BKA65DRAFT_129244 [Rhexocercosporidium sp. MPI-PUGE-AT-0058]|nr:hypothetical protein BKA65DRAFT_129244 [Rhexocercosporidium sp. MPI-PUGE-AT-0058]
MSSDNDSDISSFAEWEAQNPAQSFSEREQSMLDMKNPARVWGDRDSSNDARSSDGESASEEEVVSAGNGGVTLGGLKERRLEIPSSTQGTESQLLSQSLENDEEEEDNTMLVNNSLLSTLGTSPRTAHDLLQLKTSVQDFAVEHPFWTQTTLDEEEALEFESDVFEFAQAAGLGVNLAKLEVMRAMGAWKTSKGIPVAQANHVEQIFENVLETIEVVTENIGSGQKKKRKREGKVKAILEPTLNDTVKGTQEVEFKEPKAKRQRRREKKRKLGEESMFLAGPASAVPGPTDLVEVSKDEQADTKSQRQQEKQKRKLKGDPVSSVGAASDVYTTTSTTQKVQGEKKPRLDADTTIKTVPAAKSTVESKCAKRIKNEKKKVKKRAKQGPVTSSYFTQPDVVTTGTAKEDPSTRAKNENIPMVDAPEETDQTMGEDKSAQNEDIEQSNTAEKDEKKKRKKKRNKNRLSEVEITDPLKAAEERAARKTERSAKPKDVSRDVESGLVDVQGPAEPSVKKKRVRSRIMKQNREEAKEAVLKPTSEILTKSKKNAKQVLSSPEVNKATSRDAETNETLNEKLLVRSVGTFDDNRLFRATYASNPDTPHLAIEVAAIDQIPAKEKSRKRKKKTETETEIDIEGKPVTIQVAVPEEFEPPKKKPRNRKRKSINKLLDEQIAGVGEPVTEPLVELPDANSEKKKHKRDRSKKRSNVGTEVDAQASKEASNSRHS